MAQVAFSIRMDEDLKRDFSQFCSDIGMSMSTAFVVFAKACLREGRIPFKIGTGKTYQTKPNHKEPKKRIVGLWNNGIVKLWNYEFGAKVRYDEV